MPKGAGIGNSKSAKPRSSPYVAPANTTNNSKLEELKEEAFMWPIVYENSINILHREINKAETVLNDYCKSLDYAMRLREKETAWLIQEMKDKRDELKKKLMRQR